MYDGTPSLDDALIDLTLIQAAAHRTGVRLGRLKNPPGLYNETRDVPCHGSEYFPATSRLLR